MASIDNVFSGSSLKASDLRGREVPVQIESVDLRDFDDGKKLVLHFAGKEKVLICNKTNANRIAEKLGRDYDLWPGGQITLYPDRVEFQGALVDAIRVKIENPASNHPTNQPETLAESQQADYVQNSADSAEQAAADAAADEGVAETGDEPDIDF